MKHLDKKNFNLDDYRFGDQEEIEYNQELQDYLKIMYAQIKYDNKLVGNFSIYGTYKIEPNIKDYLIKEMKFFQERKGDVVYVSRALENLVLNFKITFTIVGKSQQAILELVEKEVRFDENDIIHTTKIDEIVKFDHDDFINYVYKEWHVFLSYQDLFLEEDAILRMFRELESFYARIGELLGVSSHLYVMSMLPILPKLGPKGNLVLNQYNNVLNNINKTNPIFSKNGLNLKKILDQLMKKFDLFSEIAKNKESLKVMKDFVEPFKEIEKEKVSIEKERSQTKEDSFAAHL